MAEKSLSSLTRSHAPTSGSWITKVPVIIAFFWLTKVATTANVRPMPRSIGSPRRRNGWSARANTNGSTGRMQGLAIVSTPPR